MGWLIALGIIVSYAVIGMLILPSIARERFTYHREGKLCMISRCYKSDSEDAHRACSSRYASVAWLAWPVLGLVGAPRRLAARTLDKDADAAKRLKELEKEAQETKLREAKELEIRRVTDPDLMTVADFDKLMNRVAMKAGR